MAFSDGDNRREAQAGAFIEVLGGKERLENLVEIFFRYTRSRISDADIT